MNDAAERDSAKLLRDLRREEDVRQMRAELIAYWDRQVGLIDAAIATVHGQGAPAMKDGDAMQRDFEAGLREFRAGFAKLAARARLLPSGGSRQAFGVKLTIFARQADKDVSLAKDPFDRLDKYEEIDDPANMSPACIKSLSKR